MDRQKRKDLSDYIIDAGEFILGAGAIGAAIYQIGGKKALSSGLKKTAMFAKAIAPDITNKSFKDFDAKTLLTITNNHILKEDSTFKVLAKNDISKDLKLNYDTNDNMASIFKRIMQFRNNTDNFIDNLYNDERILNPLKETFKTKYGKDNESFYNRVIKDAIMNKDKYISYKVDDTFTLREDTLKKVFKDTNFTNDQQEDMISSILRSLEEKKANIHGYKEEKQPLIDKMIDELENFDNLKEKLGSSTDKSNKDSFFDNLLNDTQLTLKELVEKSDANEINVTNNSIRIKTEQGPYDFEFLDYVKKLMERDSRYGDLYVGKVRTDGDNIYDFNELDSYLNDFLDSFANTLPGKLAKTRDKYYINNAPLIHYTGSGINDPILSAFEGNKNSIVNNNYIRILDKTYKINGTELEHLPDLDNYYLTSGRHGTIPRITKALAGDEESKKALNPLFQMLDMTTTTDPSRVTEFLSFFKKYKSDTWIPNIVKNFKTNEIDISVDNIENINNYKDNMNKLMTFFHNTAEMVDNKTLSTLHENTSGRTKELFSYLLKNDDELLDSISSPDFHDQNLFNSDLSGIVKKYLSNSEDFFTSKSIVSDKIAFIPNTRAKSSTDMLRMEILKEALLTEKHRSNGYNEVYNLIENTVTDNNKRELEHILNWTVLEDATNVSHSKRLEKLQDIFDSMTNATLLFSKDTKSSSFNEDLSYIRKFQESMDKNIKDKAHFLQKGLEREQVGLEEIVEGNNYGKWMYMKKSQGFLDTLKNINDETKLKGFAKQFVAGRDNMQDVTTATMFPYFMVSRLFDPLNAVGLGFSAESTKSVGDLTKNIFTKRILPIGGAILGYSMFNDLSEDITGTSVTGAALNTHQRIQLGHRKIMDAVGLTDFLDDMSGYFPIMGYWTNDEVMDAKELQDYYQNGVDPVRKGRFWGFGSSSEYRGGKISYYTPNIYRRVESDYYDKSVYGSNREKWKHSYIPNLYNPIAPLTYALNPYWLEEKHYDDRPYMTTGKMFTEGTPWGAVLNPTVGAIIKPQRRMHREDLNDDLQDVRWIIEQENMKIFERAAETDMITFTSDGQIMPTKYVPLGLADAPYAIINVSNDNGELRLNLPRDIAINNIQDASVLNDITYNIYNKESKESSTNSLNAITLSPQAYMQHRDKYNTLYSINALNENTKLEGFAATQGVKYMDTYDARPKPISTTDPQIKRDIRDTSYSEDLYRDATYSMKELMGIYGFASEQLMPPSHKFKMASADKINSFSDRFWDQNIGGLGGEIMEIARRFFPHDDRSREGFNPIRNTMPVWLPENFLLGDPYNKLPMGEARLPGIGYESMNELHPDMYGNYGAFDRYKILADIAPYSEEYKKWKKIADLTVDDPALQLEMERIEKRVEKQSKDHDFRDYKFDTKMVREEAVVSEIIGDNLFKIVGSDEVYKMAGLKFRKGDKLENYLSPGIQVDIQYAEDESERYNEEGVVSSILYTNSTNINRDLIKSNNVIEEDDGTAAGDIAKFTSSQRTLGTILEPLSHYPFSFIHTKYARIDSPLESYKNEQIYGTSYATWDHPIEGFLMPSLRKAWGQDMFNQGVSMGTWMLSNYVNSIDSSKSAKIAAGTLFGLTNPAGFAGGMIGYLSKLGGGPGIKFGANVGAVIGTAGYIYNNLDQPVNSAISLGALGAFMANQLDFEGLNNYVKENGEIIEGLPYEKLAKYFGDWKKGGLLLAGVGLGIGALGRLTGDGEYIPDKVEDKWKIEEYYDRLKYIKYEGLFRKTAKLALEKENVNLFKILEEFEEYENELNKRKNIVIRSIENDSNNLENILKTEDTFDDLYPNFDIKAGYYTKLALEYKQMADSTIYALDENSSDMEIINSLNKYDKEYFEEFMKEKDESKRKEILKLVGPYKSKVLELAWQGKSSNVKSNYEYFNSHLLPNQYWAGWKPDVDLEKVKMKTIENEGLLLSDFGLYESEKTTQEYFTAPNIKHINENNTIAPLLALRLRQTLDGAGIKDSDIEIVPNETGEYSYSVNLIRNFQNSIKEPLLAAFNSSI